MEKGEPRLGPGQSSKKYLFSQPSRVFLIENLPKNLSQSSLLLRLYQKLEEVFWLASLIRVWCCPWRKLKMRWTYSPVRLLSIFSLKSKFHSLAAMSRYLPTFLPPMTVSASQSSSAGLSTAATAWSVIRAKPVTLAASCVISTPSVIFLEARIFDSSWGLDQRAETRGSLAVASASPARNSASLMLESRAASSSENSRALSFSSAGSGGTGVSTGSVITI